MAFFFFFSSLNLFSHITLCLCLEKDWLLGKKNIAGREAWWGKPGAVLSGIARCKWFHLSHVSLKIWFWVVVLSYCCCMFALCTLAKWKCCFVCFSFLREWGRFKREFSFWSCYSSSARAVFFAYIWVSFPCQEITVQLISKAPPGALLSQPNNFVSF